MLHKPRPSSIFIILGCTSLILLTMDPGLYDAAMEGNTDLLALRNTNELEAQTTRKGNTVLHVAALFGNTKFVRDVATLCPSLLCKANIKNETALHIAANEGHIEVARVLLECARSLEMDLEPGVSLDKKMLMMVDNDEDTALHKAVRNGNCGVAKLLIESGPEAEEFVYPSNRAKETPLYLAAEVKCSVCLPEILNSCSSPAYSGPKGRTALHAAVASDQEGCVEMLLNWKQSLCQEVDEYGWTPLHLAALFGHIKIARMMLTINKSLAYMAAEKDEATALHIAAGQGHISIIEELIWHCPDCWEMTNIKGQNILHVAVMNQQKKVIEFILDSSMFSPLIGERDKEGNTPLHLLAISRCFVPRLLLHPKANKMAFNNENLNPLDLAYTENYSSDWGLIRRTLRESGPFGLRNVVQDENDIIAEEAASDKDQKIIQGMRKEAETRLIVASLIATVTFAAGFTVPGGYINDGSDEGMAVLARKAAFIAFVITDTIALICSTCAAFIYFLKVDFINRHKIIRHYILAKAFITISMGAVVIAFFTGLAAVLEKSPTVTFVVGLICCSSFLVYYYELRPAFRSMQGRPRHVYSEQLKRRGRPTYMIWGHQNPPQEFVRF